MRLVLIAAIALAAGCGTTSNVDRAAAIVAARSQLDVLVATERIPGLAVAVTHGDRSVWEQHFGVADLDKRTPVNEATRFRVGSVSKLFTVAAMMRLVEQRRLSLDEPVSTYVPAFPHAVTLRQLSGHLAGIRHYGRNEFLNQTAYSSATDSLRKFASDPLLHAPGSAYFYSSYGYNVIGAAIESATGQRFDEAVRALVFEPAGMTATSFASTPASAKPYDKGKAGPDPSPVVDLSDRWPAGGAESTARDLARFLIATAGSLHSAATRGTMFTLQATADGKPTIAGIGWRVATDEAGRTFVHHGGAVTGGRAFVLLYPEERVGVAITTNLGYASFDERQAGAIARLFLPAR